MLYKKWKHNSLRIEVNIFLMLMNRQIQSVFSAILIRLNIQLSMCKSENIYVL